MTATSIRDVDAPIVRATKDAFLQGTFVRSQRTKELEWEGQQHS
jgi:hypothetical protein